MARAKKTMDGNTAAAWVSYPFSEVAAIFPITPSSVMAELTDEWAANGKKNLFGQEVKVVEMQSEGGAAGALHGSLASGALTTTYTASQGLLLMIPNLYKIAGEMLPAVLNVSARAIATHALSIFGDHSDVMACRQTGFALLCSNDAQEVMDLGAVAHLSAIKGRVPFIHFFDGFRTSHEISKIEVWDDADLRDMLDFDAVDAFRKSSMNPERPILRGTAQNPDIFFQASEASNRFYAVLPALVESYMDKVNAKIGTNYKLFNYYGAPDAKNVIVAMGSVCDTIEETVDYLNAKGEKVGLLKVRLYRPFSVEHFLKELPATVEKIAVLDRTKEPGATGEPLFLDVCAAYAGKKDAPMIVAGRYGLGSKDTIPSHILSVYENLKADEPKTKFTISIVDDVTNLSLPVTEDIDTAPEGTISCKFWGLGSDGTVGANKNSIKIIGDNTDMYAQAYFSYDSKKSGGITTSHLRFGKKPIKSTYLIDKADFVACHNQSYVYKYDMIGDIKPGGTFLLNTVWKESELDEKLPGEMKAYIANNNINFYIVDGVEIARELGLGNRINMVLQAAFFKLANIIPIDDAVKYMKAAVEKTYGAKGEKVVKMNCDAIDRGVSSAVKVNVPASWKNAKAEAAAKRDVPEFIEKILIPVNSLKGDKLPVSTFVGREDGHLEVGSSAYEKRGIAVDVPEWTPENCAQCNRCAIVCPHAAIRPIVYTEAEATSAPADTKYAPKFVGKGVENFKFSIAVSPLDCTGCGNCANICPGNKGGKALNMKSIESQMPQQAAYDYAVKLPPKELPFARDTVKGSQFVQPLLEYSGACAGCGETPYAKLVTQLFGERAYIANATGCSSIWGGSAPSTPYTKNHDGRGPAWSNSLFEDNAEYGLGMYTGAEHIRARLVNVADALSATCGDEGLKALVSEWKAAASNSKTSMDATAKLVSALEAYAPKNDTEKAQKEELLKDKEYMAKKSMWIFGGDGWAYDIGFGGLDHVIASGENVNILVFDTEVYSNTGGQSSKSTPRGAVAQFAAAGKANRKKDLAGIAMSYGNVYVASIAMGSDYNQCVKALVEAESYEGPSLIIAYATCINHGMTAGMGFAQRETKAAVDSGYWFNFRYDPRKKAAGENPFMLDSKEPTKPYRDFIGSQVRYTSLVRNFPERAKVLFEYAEQDSKERYQALKKLAEQ
ncbi:MAG: pyruvate:ferredoxin (flavodoxin) oxidoreductase [Clostridia bacterium]|nr:pyruvate:ferredoxin (flavodoxin) oxidoreductase [Clostridia bacterium]